MIRPIGLDYLHNFIVDDAVPSRRQMQTYMTSEYKRNEREGICIFHAPSMSKLANLSLLGTS